MVRRTTSGPIAGVVACLLAIATIGCAAGSPNSAGDPLESAIASRSADPVTSLAAATLRYVALGDSYTIGTSESIDARWPNQLVVTLGPATNGGQSGVRLDLVANLGVNGFTSGDVIATELPALDALRPEFITLLVGVNDVVQGVPAEIYRANIEMILSDAVRRVGAGRILVVTTPDYTVTPAGADYGDPTHQAAAILTFNGILTTAAAARGIAVVDVHDLSLRAATDRSLVASDGLHPSGSQYALWVERIAPAARRLILP